MNTFSLFLFDNMLIHVCVYALACVCARGVCMYILVDVSFLPGGVFSNNFPSLLYIHPLRDAQVFFHE